MSSLFYSRYVPPSSKPAQSRASDESVPKDKAGPRKRHNTGRHISESSEIAQEPKSGKRKTSQANLESKRAQHDRSSNETHVHDSILSKYAQSRAKAEQQILPHVDQTPNPKAQKSLVIPQPDPVPEEKKTYVSAWTDTVETTSDSKEFSNFSLAPCIQEALHRLGFNHATPVQTKVLELYDERRDLCVQTPTGSGKTLAYAIPMISDLDKYRGTALRGLVVLPSTALVEQATRSLADLSQISRLKVISITGDQPRDVEARRLLQARLVYDPFTYAEQKPPDFLERLLDWETESEEEEPHAGWVREYEAQADILVCTPWSLSQHVRSSRGFSLKDVQWLVVDEVDQCIAHTHRRWIDVVMPMLRRSSEDVYVLPKQVRKILLSATMQRDLVKLKSLFDLRRPVLVMSTEEVLPSTSETTTLPPTLTEMAHKIDDACFKPLYLMRILDKLMPDCSRSSSSISSESSSSDDTESAEMDLSHILVFTSSSSTAHRLSRLVQILRPEKSNQVKSVTALISRPQRRRLLSRFQNSRFRVLVTTDLLAHGIDFMHISHVINYDMPRSLEEYVHRVGRTARADRPGIAITMVEHKQGRWFWQIMEALQRTESQSVRKEESLPVNDNEQQLYNSAVEQLAIEAGPGNAPMHHLSERGSNED